MHFLLNFLNLSLLTGDTWQLEELNAITSASDRTSEILTIAFFGRPEEIEPYIRVAEVQRTPKIVITNNYGDIGFKHVLGLNRNIFFVAIGFLERRSMWNHLNNAFLDIQSNVRGVFITTRPRKKDPTLNFKEHFQWCWQKGFTAALVLVDNENALRKEFEIYNYNPFLTQKLMNVTKSEKSELFVDKFRNLHKYEIRTSAEFDPPRVFGRRHCVRRNKPQLLGYVASLFQAFLKEYNAGVNVVNYSTNRSYNILDVIYRVNHDEIDISINPYIPYPGVHLSYPIRMLQRCIVVPFPEELPKYRYFIMPFKTRVWLGFLLAWFIFCVSYIYSWFFMKKLCRCKSPDVGKICLEVWRLLMFLPTPTTCCFKCFKWFYPVWFSHIAVLGFILSNLYMASLTSFFSGLTFKPLIGTLQELVNCQIPIDTIDYEIPAILENRGLPNGFSNLLKPRNASELIDETISLKEGQSFSALEDRIMFTLNQQIHLKQPISYAIKECITTVPFGFLMPAHSQFEFPINRFILRSASAGLIDKWYYDSIKDGYCSGILKMRIPQLKVARPLTLEHFQFGWFVLGAGYVVGLLVFLIENLKRLGRRIKIFILYY